MTDTRTRPGRSRLLAPAALTLLVAGLGALACTGPPPGPGPGPTAPPTTPGGPGGGRCHPAAVESATLVGTELRVQGPLSSVSQKVKLVPVVYIRQPEFWQIDVIACDPEVGLPTIGSYDLKEDVSASLGTEGVLVVGANKSVKLPLAPAGPAFVGQWRVTGVTGGFTGEVVPLVPGTSISLAFDRASKVNGKACNSYFGTWSGTAADLKISDVGATKMACTEPAGVMAQEQRYFGALPLVTSAKVSGGSLSLIDAQGRTIVTAVPAGPIRDR